LSGCRALEKSKGVSYGGPDFEEGGLSARVQVPLLPNEGNSHILPCRSRRGGECCKHGGRLLRGENRRGFQKQKRPVFEVAKMLFFVGRGTEKMNREKNALGKCEELWLGKMRPHSCDDPSKEV